MVLDLIETNWINSGEIRMSPEVEESTNLLRDFLFEHVYVGSEAKREEAKAIQIVQSLFHYFSEHIELLPDEYLQRARSGTAERAVCDYIAGMTDRFAIRIYQKYFLPLPWLE
jgi:dGTPase